MLSLQLLAQRTVTNRICPSCRPYEQYQVNAQGNMHGYYKAWDRQGKLIQQYNYVNGDLHGICRDYFSNGTIKEDAVYYKGRMTNLKIYAYVNNKRQLVKTKAWDKSGTLVIDSGNMGKLPNGRWKRHYPSYGNYAEIYNNNDTVYIWDDTDKKKFLGKQINSKFMEYKSQLDIELAIRDSIRSAAYNVYSDQPRNDSLLAISTHYVEVLSICFGDGEGNAANSDEQQFYEFLCKYLKIGKDEHLIALIIDALDLQYISDVRNLTLRCRSDNKWQASIVVTSNRLTHTLISSCNLPYQSYSSYSYGATTPYIQAKMLKIIRYLEKMSENGEII